MKVILRNQVHANTWEITEKNLELATVQMPTSVLGEAYVRDFTTNFQLHQRTPRQLSQIKGVYAKVTHIYNIYVGNLGMSHCTLAQMPHKNWLHGKLKMVSYQYILASATQKIDLPCNNNNPNSPNNRFHKLLRAPQSPTMSHKILIVATKHQTSIINSFNQTVKPKRLNIHAVLYLCACINTTAVCNSTKQPEKKKRKIHSFTP